MVLKNEMGSWLCLRKGELISNIILLIKKITKLEWVWIEFSIASEKAKKLCKTFLQMG
jgi:hypothetical protein